MKRMFWLPVSLAVLLLVLGGCGKKENEAHHASADNNLEPIKVELKVDPTEVQIGAKVTFEATVTHQGNNVDDASEVMFEFWKDGDKDEDHSKEIVTGSGNGKYVFETSFDEAGQYHVISHVTARDQHSMPSADFTVK